MGDYQDRIVGDEAVSRLTAAGYSAADLHVHSIYSEDVLAAGTHPEALVQRAFRRGLRFVSITDHDTMDAYVRVLGWDREGVIPGVEVKILDPCVGHTVHVNVYTLSHAQFRDLEDIARGSRDIEAFVRYCREHDLPHVLNHPFWSATGEPSPSPATVAGLARLFPVLEWNMGRVAGKNRSAARMAAAFGKGLVANTDTHTGDVGRARTYARGDSFEEFFGAVARGEAWLLARDLCLPEMARVVRDTIRGAFSLDRRMLLELGITAPKGDFTGFRVLDGLVDVAVHGRLDSWLRVKGALRGVLLGVSSLRFLQSLYVAVERREAREILRRLPEALASA